MSNTIIVVEQWDGFHAYVKNRPQNGHGPTMEHAIGDLMIQCSRDDLVTGCRPGWPEMPQVKRPKLDLTPGLINGDSDK